MQVAPLAFPVQLGDQAVEPVAPQDGPMRVGDMLKDFDAVFDFLRPK